MLEISDIRVRYGAIVALRGITINVGKEEVVGIVGPNGAGKSTLLLSIAGAVPIEAGCVNFAGRSLNGIPPEQVVRAGIAFVTSGKRVFTGLTIEENLRLGTFHRRDRRGVSDDIERMLATFPFLADRRSSLADRLSGGEQQQLAIARALLGRPRLLLLDEPSLGLAPMMVDRVYNTLSMLKATGTSMLLVEQNPTRLKGLADRLYVLNKGIVSISGSTDHVLEDNNLENALFGMAEPNVG